MTSRPNPQRHGSQQDQHQRRPRQLATARARPKPAPALGRNPLRPRRTKIRHPTHPQRRRTALGRQPKPTRRPAPATLRTHPPQHTRTTPSHAPTQTMPAKRRQRRLAATTRKLHRMATRITPPIACSAASLTKPVAKQTHKAPQSALQHGGRTQRAQRLRKRRKKHQKWIGQNGGTRLQYRADK